MNARQDPIVSEVAQPLDTDGASQAVCISENQRAEVLETPYARQLTTGGGKAGQGYPAIRQGMLVRRLTPLECERLQGLKDDWTRYYEDGSEVPDSIRYAGIGDAVCANVSEWLGERFSRFAGLRSDDSERR